MPCLAYLVNLPSQKQTNKQEKPGALLTALEVDKITLQDSITWQRKSRINNNNNNNNNKSNNDNINNFILAIIIIIIIIIIIMIIIIISIIMSISTIILKG